MSDRKNVTSRVYAKWERLKKEAEQCAFNLCESNGARAKRRLGAARQELDEMTIAVHGLRRLTDPQLVKELACKLVQKTGRDGDAPAAHRIVTELLVEMARHDFDERERLRGLGANVRRSPRFQRYADHRVVGALVEAVVASTRVHPRLGKEERQQQNAARLEKTKALARNHGKSDAECRKELRTRRHMKSGTSAPDQHVFVAAWLVRATAAPTAGAYQSQVRAARER